MIQELRTMLLLSFADGLCPVASVVIFSGVCMRAISSLVITSSAGPVSEFLSCLRLRVRLA